MLLRRWSLNKENKKMKKHKKTPLQEWAWERFQMKGTIAGMRIRLKQLACLGFTTPNEKRLLWEARRILRKIEDNWDQSQAETRCKV